MSISTFPSGLISGALGSFGLEWAFVDALASLASTLFRYIYGFSAGVA
jgi:hypothetical protein